jgi:hypothetical protein
VGTSSGVKRDERENIRNQRETRNYLHQRVELEAQCLDSVICGLWHILPLNLKTQRWTYASLVRAGAATLLASLSVARPSTRQVHLQFLFSRIIYLYPPTETLKH